MDIYRIILSPKAPISNFPSSDTLFGAFCWGIRTLYGETELTKNVLTDFPNQPRKFILSSTFPLLIDETSVCSESLRVFFYPFPILPDCQAEDLKEIVSSYKEKFRSSKHSLCEIVNLYKKFKKSSFISESIFRDILKGNQKKTLFSDYLRGMRFSKESSWCPDQLGGLIKIVDDMLLKDKEYKELFGNGKYPKLKSKLISSRNKIDRITNSTSGAGQLYYSPNLFLSGRVKLYFFILTEDIDFLRPILKFLSDTGIGGDRSVGKGRYELSEPEKVDLPAIQEPNFFVNLSRYLPQQNEIDFEKEPLFYRLLPYRSKVEASYFRSEDIWKDRVIYFQEGSIFPLSDHPKSFYGELKKVKKINNQKIMQNGLTIPIFGNWR